MKVGGVFFKGEGRVVLQDLRRYIEAHLRSYVYNELKQHVPGEKQLLEKLLGFLTPYQLIVSNVGLLISDLLKLVDDDVTKRYARYIEIIDAIIEGKYDFEEWPIAGFFAATNAVDDITVYVVVADFDNNALKLIELTEARLRPVDPDP